MKATEITGRMVDRFADRSSDWINPILVKETRQALKSRQFIATFLLLLTICWVASFLYVLGVYGQYNTGPGRQLFTFYYLILAITGLVLVPFTAYRSLQTEREQQSYEVLSVTTLKPRQILLGKLGSAVVQMFIYYSALMPFISFTYLLRGIDFPTIAYLLAVGAVQSIVVSLIALTISTVSAQRQWQMVSSGGVLFLLAIVVMMTIQVVGEFLRPEARPDFHSKEFWFINAAVLVVVFSYGLLLEQIAVAQLTFDSDNRSTGVRIVASGLHLLVMAAPLGEWLWLGTTNSLSPPLVFITMLQLTVIGLFVVTEPDKLSHRLERNLGRLRALRLPALFYYPGGARGLWYFAAHLGLMMFLVWGVGILSTRRFLPGGVVDPRSIGSPQMWKAILIVVQYMVIYLGWAAAIARGGRALFHEFRPALARVLAVIIAMGLTLIPLILDVAEIFPKAKPWVAVFNPILVLSTIDSVGQGNQAIVMLAIWCGATVLLNLPAMFRAAVETLGRRIEVVRGDVVVVQVPTGSTSS